MRKSAVFALVLCVVVGAAFAMADAVNAPAALAAAAPALAANAASPQTTVQVPPLAGRVNDLAHLLDAPTAMALEAKLADYEKTTGNQLVLLTVTTLGGLPLEEYSLKVAEAWKLGKKGVDNGALLFIAKEERKIRIEVGYGLEPSLTDAATSFIIRDKMTPRFQAGDYQSGITAAFEAMMQAAEGKLDMTAASGGGQTGGGRRQLPLLLFVLLALAGYGFMGMITWFGLFTKGGGTAMIYIMLFAGYGLAGSALNIRGTKLGYVLFFAFVLGFPAAKIIVGKTAFGKKQAKKIAAMAVSHGGSGASSRSGGLRTYSSHSSSSHSSSGGGGGGFSGGGGSFGGGGASGGW